MMALISAVLLGILLCTAAPAAALDLNEWIPGLTLTPFLSEGIQYDDNVFQQPTKPKDDLIFRTMPGFLAEYAGGRNSLSLGYRAEVLRYLDLTSQDTINHFGVGQLRVEFPRIIANLRDDFTHTNSPPNTELTGPIVSDTNILVPALEYRLRGRFSVGANYTWTRVTFERADLSQQLDRDEHLVGPSVFWKFRPKADLSLNYAYGWTDFDTAGDRDVTRNLVTLAARGDITAKLSSTFHVGVEDREPVQSGLRGSTDLVFGGGWVYRPDGRTTVTLDTSRGLQESVFGTGKFFVATMATLSATHNFLPKLSANLSLTGGSNDYPTEETLNGRTKARSDLLLGWGGGIGYDVQRWMRLHLDFTHVLRDSNFHEFNFNEDKITGTATFQF